MAENKTAGLVFAVALLALVSCVVNLATTFTDSVFLSEYPVKALPFYLMGINFASLALSMFILWAVGKSNTWKGFTVLGCLLAFAAIFARFGPMPIDWEYSEASRLVLVHTFALMVNVASWNFAANQVHSSHARSWLPAMASGLTVGGLVGGVITVMASGFFKIYTLHEITTVFLCVAIPFPFLFGRIMSESLQTGGRTKSYAAQAISVEQKTYQKAEISIFKDPLVGFLATVTLLFAIAGTLADYQYKATLQDQGAAEKVALFLGILNTTLNILVLMGQWGFVSKLLNKTSLKGLFGLYPWPILGSIALSFVLPSLYGSFLVRLLERSLRPLIFYSATDTLVAPMRSALKSKVIWLNKGIMTPLGTLLAMGLVMVLFETSPELVTSPTLIYGLMSMVLVVSLFAGRSLSRIYQLHLRKSLGLELDEGNKENSKQSPSIDTISMDQTSVFDPTVLMGTSFVSESKLKKVFAMEGNERLLSLITLFSPADEAGVEFLLGRVLQEDDPNVLLHILRLLKLSKAHQPRMPHNLLQHPWPEIQYLSRYLASDSRGAFNQEVKKELTNCIVRDRSFKKFGLVFAGALEVLEPEDTTSWWETFLKTAPNNKAVILEILTASFLKGTPLDSWGFANDEGLRHKDLKPLMDYVEHHPSGKVFLRLFRREQLSHDFWTVALNARGESTRIFLVLLDVLIADNERSKAFLFEWAHQLKANDALILSSYLECGSPTLRRQAMSLFALLALRFGENSLPQKPIVRGLQKTIRESLLVAGAMGEVFVAQENQIMAGVTLSRLKRNQAYRLLNRAFEHQIELFFAFSGLLFGSQITKQAFARFRQGSDFTRANVVEFFRAGELQSVVAPMLNLLNISLPKDMVPFVIKELKLPPGSSVAPRLMSREGFEWFETFIKNGSLPERVSTRLMALSENHVGVNSIQPEHYVAFYMSLGDLSPEALETRLPSMLEELAQAPPASLMSFQARLRDAF